MSSPGNISVIAFDMFGTLVRNETSEWAATLAAIAEEQGLGIDGARLHAEWGAREVEFRKGRTNMQVPEASPPFRTYREAWRDAFARTFDALCLPGDADLAADRCVDDLCLREPFPDVETALHALDGRFRLAVMSNADDRFLTGAIKRHRWHFDAVISSEQARAYKPDQRAFLALVKAAGVPPDQVLYVGDSAYDDVHGAKLAGMWAVLVRRDQTTPGRTPPPDGLELLAPDYVVESLAELPALLR